MTERLKKMWEAQRRFSELHYDVGDMDEETREAKTRELALALHHEVSKLVSGVHFRGHRDKVSPANRDKVLYEAVDAIRYSMAICNLWNFDDADFEVAWWDKDAYLNIQHHLQGHRWDGRPVVIWDIDDVLADFRNDFSSWVREAKGIPIDPTSKEYFFIEQLVKTGYNSLGLYEEYIRERRVASTPPTDAVEVMNRLHDEGIWNHLVTARPKENLICKYDTYHWLRNVGAKFDGLDFTGEKLAFVSRTEYCVKSRILCCVDDGPTHVNSYLAHGFRCFMPVTSYNGQVRRDPNLTRYTSADELYDGITRIWRDFE